MQVGFAVFAAIADEYPLFRSGDVRGTAVEVFPEASAVLLEGRLRSKVEPKVQFRRRVLERHGVDCTGLASIDAVDAALAALTGILALEGTFSTVGEPGEGVILVPVAALPSVRLERPAGDPTSVSMAKSSASASNAVAGGFCQCGCGATVRRRFLPGHDARLKSRLLRLQAEGRAATQHLRELGWGDNGEI